MESAGGKPPAKPPAWLVVHGPAGERKRVAVEPLPFTIGRHSRNCLALADTRISRDHARIVATEDGYAVEDLHSRNGTFVNQERVECKPLAPGDRIDFGSPDSYFLVFDTGDSPLARLEEAGPAMAEPGANLARLRAVAELARAVETSLAPADLLAALVGAALTITGAERGFLLLKGDAGLEIRLARDNRGAALAAADLRVPLSLIGQALAHRRELLSMTFDPNAGDSSLPSRTVAELSLRSAVCIPLVKLRSGGALPAGAPPDDETLGVLYMDSRAGAADLSAGNPELLQTLALEASTILENTRLLEGERARQRMEEELKIARQIQSSLLPPALPASGWFRAAGKSVPSRQVGGDYYDARRLGDSVWAFINADVSGKGVSAALLASLLQGAFLAAPHAEIPPGESMARLNAFLLERTKGEKYATVFLGVLHRHGRLRYVNAGHAGGLLVRARGAVVRLEPTGLPAGMIEEAEYSSGETVLEDGDKLILYTDGFTEAESSDGEFFGEARLRAIARRAAACSAQELFATLDAALAAHTGGALQRDDITFMTVEYRRSEV